MKDDSARSKVWIWNRLSCILEYVFDRVGDLGGNGGRRQRLGLGLADGPRLHYSGDFSKVVGGPLVSWLSTGCDAGLDLAFRISDTQSAILVVLRERNCSRSEPVMS